MGYITRLDAVNEMLLAAGESLVSDLDDASGIDTEIAEFILDRTEEEFQMRGLASNKYIKKIKPDGNQKIYLPSDVMSVRLLSHHTSDDPNGQYDNFTIQIGIRGEPNGYLFNVTEQTDKWDVDEEYTVEFIQRIRWEDMDTTIQKAIVVSSARQYQMVTQGDDAADSYLAQKEMFNSAKGRAAAMHNKHRNIFESADLGRRAIRRDRYTTNDPSRFRFWRHK